MGNKPEPIIVPVNIEGMSELKTALKEATRLVELLKEAQAILNSLGVPRYITTVQLRDTTHTEQFP